MSVKYSNQSIESTLFNEVHRGIFGRAEFPLATWFLALNSELEIIACVRFCRNALNKRSDFSNPMQMEQCGEKHLESNGEIKLVSSRV